LQSDFLTYIACAIVFALFVSIFILPVGNTHHGHWTFTPAGSAIVLSLIGVFMFLGSFLISGFFSAFYLSYNPWIYDVDDMGFWFNPSFMVWLFAKDRKRWAKWQTGANAFGAVYFGIILFLIFSLQYITPEAFILGAFFCVGIVSLFSFIFYKVYVSTIGESETEAIPSADDTD
jgi:hypothetical protein